MTKKLLSALTLMALAAMLSINVSSLIPNDADLDGVPDSVDLCPGENSSLFDRNGDGCIDDPRGARHVEYWGWQDSIITYVINNQGVPAIANGSDFTAVQAGFSAWTAIPGVDLAVNYGGTTPQIVANGTDGINLVTFVDNTAGISSLVLALGVATSFTSDTLIAGRVYRKGEVYDADMIFNPTKQFKTSTSGVVGADVQSVACHEAGHVCGISHSCVRSSTMFYVLPGGIAARTPELEDQSMMLKSYPEASLVANRIDGTVIGGTTSMPVPGVAVFAIDAGSGDTVSCAYTLPNGAYTLFGIPDGSYYVAIHPLDGSSRVGFIQPGNINAVVEGSAITVVVPEYWDLAESATDDETAKDVVAVSGGSSAVADIVTNIDDTPPTVVSHNPANGESSQPIDGAIIIKFSESIDVSTITANFIVQRISDSTGTAGTIAILHDDSLIAFTPSPPLSFGEVYELRLATGLSDLFGNGLATPLVVSFTTEPEPPLAQFSLVPNKGVVNTTVVINGAGFSESPMPTVSFDGVMATVTSVLPGRIITSVPPGASTGDVIVTNPDLLVSNSLTFTILSESEIARGYESGQTQLTSVPNDLVVTPDGAYAYIGTETGYEAIIIDDAMPGYLNAAAFSHPGGLSGVSALPDGRRVYGVSKMSSEFVEIDSDPTAGAGLFNEILNVEPMDAQPLKILVDRFGYRAYITTTSQEIQAWDIELGSPTFRQQVGVMYAPGTLRGAMAMTPDGSRLLAITDNGQLLFFDVGPDTLGAQVNVGIDPRRIVIDALGQRAYVTHGDGDVSVVAIGPAAPPYEVQDIETGGSLRGIVGTPAANYLYGVDIELNKMKIIDIKDPPTATFRSVIADFPLDINPIAVKLSPDGRFAYTALQGGGMNPPRMLVTTIGLGPTVFSVTPSAARTGSWISIAGQSMADGIGYIGSVKYTGATSGASGYLDPTHWTALVPGAATTGPLLVTRTPDYPPHTQQLSNSNYFTVLDTSDTGDDAMRYIAQLPMPGGVELNPDIAISNDGRHIYTGAQDGNIYVYDGDPTSPTFHQALTPINVFPDPVRDVGIMPDGVIGWAVCFDTDSVVTFHARRTDPNYGNPGPALAMSGFDPFFNPYYVSCSPNNRFVVVVTENSTIESDSDDLYVIDAAGIAQGTGPQVIGLIPITDASDFAWDPTGLRFYACRATGDVIAIDLFSNSITFETIVDVQNIPIGATVEVPASIAMRPDLSSLLVRRVGFAAGQRSMALVDPPIVPFGGTAMNLNTIISMGSSGAAPAFNDLIRVSPKNDRVVIAEENGTLQYWDIDNLGGAPINGLITSAMTSQVDMEFSPDGERLYLASTFHDNIIVYDFEGSAFVQLVGGGDQTGVINEPLPAPIRVLLTDITGSPIVGAAVTFAIETGGGSFLGAPMAMTVTNVNGLAQTFWTLGPELGQQKIRITGAQFGFGQFDPLYVNAFGVSVADSVPLTRLAVAPATSDVNVGTSVLLTFNRAVDPATVGNSSLFLRAVGGPALPVAYGFAAASTRVSMTPLATLSNSTTYEVVTTAAVLDTAGSGLTNPSAEVFTTGLAAAPQLFSIGPPSAVAGVPIVLSGANFDPVAGNNTVVFNGGVAVSPTTGTAGNLVVPVPFGAISGDVRVAVGPDTTNGVPFNVLVASTSSIDDVIANVGTGAGTKGLAYSPDGAYVYCVSSDGNIVIPVSADSLTSEPGIPVGSQPVAIAIDPVALLAYVCNFGVNTLSIIDIDPSSSDYHTVIQTLIVGSNPIDVIVLPGGGRVFVANAGSGNVSIVDSDGTSVNFNTVIANVGTGAGTKGLAVSPDGAWLYVGTGIGFDVINLSTNAVIANVGTGAGTKGLAVSPDGGLLYLLTNSGEVLIVDVAVGSSTQNQVIANVGTGAGTKGLAVSPDGGLLYLIQDDTDEVVVIAVSVIPGVSVIYDATSPSFTVDWEIVSTFPTGSDPAAIAFDPRGTGAFFVAVPGDKSVEARGTGFGCINAHGEVTPRTLNLDSKGRWINASIVFAPPYFPEQVDVSTVLLNDSIPAVPDKVKIDGNEISLKFDRQMFQELVPNGDSVEVVITGLVGTRCFETTDTIRTIRPKIIQPNMTTFAVAGMPFTIIWQSPAGQTVDRVDVEWSANDGETWQPVAMQIPDYGATLWSVPNIITEEARVSVTLYQSGEPIGIGMSYPFVVTVPVPVRLVSFDANVEDGTAVLRWKTVTEVGVESFRLYRSEVRDGAYLQINNGTVPASGATGGAYEIRDNTVNANKTYFYKLEEVTKTGVPGAVFGPYSLTYRVSFALEQNVPNPFNPSTTIAFSIPDDGLVQLRVYDVGGRLVKTLVNGHRRANAYKLSWDGTNDAGQSIASGVYFYRLNAGKYVQTRKMILLK